MQVLSKSLKNMYFYQAYGLKIKSALLLPELISGQEIDADVIVQLTKLQHSPLKTDSTPHCYQLTEQGMYIHWEGVGTFLVREGKEILIEPVPEADEDRLRLFILGAAIGVILHQRGFLVLHGSAVAINDQAVVFLGDKGWGKSTIAANFHARGHSLIGDDVIALDLNSDNQPIVLPAFPQLKLWPDAVASIGIDSENLPRLVPHLEKRDRRLDSGFVQQTIPLHRVYVLGRDDALEIKSLQPQEIMKYLMRNSYITRFGKELLPPGEGFHFLRLMKLARQVPIYRLLRPCDLSLLNTTVDLVEEHLTQKILTTTGI